MKGNKTEYKNYKIEDFILDDSFINFATNKYQPDVTKWEKWLSDNPKNKEIALNAKMLIRVLRFEKQELSRAFVNDEWLKLETRLNLKEIPSVVKKRKVFDRKIWQFAAAASLLMFFTSIIYYFTSIPKYEEVVYYQELVVPRGEIQKTTLPDGTLVFINSDSKLKYDQNFGNEQREVFLEGEAWFDVTLDAEIPFIVHTQENDIKVLGTAFNVCAYPNDDVFRTSLERGKISVSYDNEETVELKVNQTYLLLKDSKQFSISETINIQSYSSWKEGKTEFRNLPFTDILRKLERSHNVTVNLLNEEVGKCKYTGSFSKQDDIITILGVIRLPTDFEYEIINDSIIIK